MSSFKTLEVSYQNGGVLVTDGVMVLVRNTDLNNTLYFGDDQSIDVVNGSDNTPLPPGASVVLDGKVPTYINAALNLPAFVAIYPYGTGYFQP